MYRLDREGKLVHLNIVNEVVVAINMEGSTTCCPVKLKTLLSLLPLLYTGSQKATNETLYLHRRGKNVIYVNIR